MLKFRSALSPEEFAGAVNHDPYLVTAANTANVGSARGLLLGSFSLRPFVRRQLSPEGGRALEILGHAIEYLADEYAADTADKGPLGSADPRVEAIQMLKALNRAIYYSGTEVQPAFRRMRRWALVRGT